MGGRRAPWRAFSGGIRRLLKRGPGGVDGRPRDGRWAQRGIVFIGLVVTVGVMAVLLLAAVQPYKTVLQRDREEELIFRGEDIAEAIREYQKGHAGQFPTELKALVKADGLRKRRYLRRLYRNPFDIEEGKWGLLSPGMTVMRPDGKGGLMAVDPKDLKPGEVPAGGMQVTGVGGYNPNQTRLPGQTGAVGAPPGMGMVLPFKFGGEEGQPILGVYAPQKVEAFKEYMGKKNISEWAFSPLVIQPKGVARPGQPTQPGGPGQPVGPGGTPVGPSGPGNPPGKT